MKSRRLTLTVIFMCCALLLQTGCEEETTRRRDFSSDWFRQQTLAARMSRVGQPAPRIAFEKLAHHFGDLGPGASPICEFKFTNIGDDFLEISQIEKTCGCTPYELKQTRYAPAESGVLRVQYYAESQLGDILKKLYVHTNDWRNPRVALSVKARIISKVSFEPQTLKLSLVARNGGCSPIVLTSVDDQPFSITHFVSTGHCITANINPSEKATRFVLYPIVDVNKLEQILNGRIEIGLAHPECKQVSISVNARPRFRVSPPSIVVRDAEAQLPAIRKVNIYSNYNENFELESALSKKDIVKVLNHKKIKNGYELELEVTPPSTRSRTFSESFSLKLKGGKGIEIPCSGSYAQESLESRNRVRTPVRRVRGGTTRRITGAASAASATSKTSSASKSSGDDEDCEDCGKTFYFNDPSKTSS